MIPRQPAEQDTRSRILQAAEDLLHLHGPEKMTVVEVARHLGMSHANVYKHFASKAELRSAVVELWLARVTKSLAPIVTADAGADRRIRDWVRKLVGIKRAKVHDDPEMFRTYHALAESARGAVEHHIAGMTAQLATILRDGETRGEWRVSDPEASARALLNATLRFHHPHFLMDTVPNDSELEQVLDLLIAGLQGQRATPPAVP
ncbi:MAG: TetR/AcrR family transcriptional regulator [Bryobacteraceae bacterium]|nr:TetR/AcrR family transcriptional regulator [Bryobacteraceae bacterium]